MRKMGILLAVVMATMVLPAAAMAAPPAGSKGECVQAVKAGTIALLDSPNDVESGKLGDAISDGFFGNEPNLLNTNTDDDLGPNEVAPGSQAGNVAPSLSPGPKVTGGGFLTWGTIKKAGGIGSIKTLCGA